MLKPSYITCGALALGGVVLITKCYMSDTLMIIGGMLIWFSLRYKPA